MARPFTRRSETVMPIRRIPSPLKPFVFPVLLVGVMAIIHILGAIGLTGAGPMWGVVPRTMNHPWGIVTFHLIHASWSHWFSNALPLIVLSGLAQVVTPRASLRTWLLMPILSGALLWVFGRSSIHVGASALVYGWFFFLLGAGLFRGDWRALAGLLAAVTLYGGLIWVLSAPSGVSWEGHLAGAISGVLCAWLWRQTDPVPYLFTPAQKTSGPSATD